MGLKRLGYLSSYRLGQGDVSDRIRHAHVALRLIQPALTPI